MSMEKLNTDLRAAKAQLEKGSAEANAGRETGKTMAITAGQLGQNAMRACRHIPHYDPNSPAPNVEASPNDIISTLCIAAGLYTSARADLHATMGESDNNHIQEAHRRLYQAADILQQDGSGAIPAAERVNANIDVMNEKIAALADLIARAHLTATRLQTRLNTSASYAQLSTESIASYQQQAGLPE